MRFGSSIKYWWETLQGNGTYVQAPIFAADAPNASNKTRDTINQSDVCYPWDTGMN